MRRRGLGTAEAGDPSETGENKERGRAELEAPAFKAMSQRMDIQRKGESDGQRDGESQERTKS